MKPSLTHRKRMIVFNLLFLSLLIIISYLSYFFLFQKNARETTIGKIKMLTERSAQEMSYNLEKISALSRLLFLDEDFQNDVERLMEDHAQEQYDRIFRHFSSASILENLVKDVAYFPCDSSGEIRWTGELSGSIYLSYLNKNIPYLAENAELAENQKGNLFYQPIFYPEGEQSPYFSLTRVVRSTKQEDYFRRIGVGTMLISRMELKEYFREIDWLEGTGMRLLTGTGEVVADSFDHFDEISQERYLIYDVPLGFLDWNIRCYYDTSHLYDATKPVLLPLILVLTGAAVMLVCTSFLFNFRNTKAMQCLLDTFQNIKSGEIEAKIEMTDDPEVNQVARHFNSMMDAVNELNQRSVEEQQKLLRLQLENSEYELKMLHAQINQHFLFNVLGGIRSFIVCGKNEQAEECLLALSDFLRFSLNPQDIVSVETECRQLQAYLSIQNMRYPKIEVEMDIPETIRNYRIPKLILQPIVENAYLHGLKNQKGKIVVSAWEEEDFLFFSVKDDGMGMDEKTLESVRQRMVAVPEGGGTTDREGHHGLALANIFRRLILRSSKNAVRIDGTVGSGTTVLIQIEKTAE